jgi:ribosomal protein S18 acetylase RimI-like enzyme
MAPVVDVDALRRVVEAEGLGVLAVDDLRLDDLDHLGWSGERAHLRSIARQLEREGEVDYLAVRAPDGAPVGKAAIDYAAAPGRGIIWQVAVHDGLHGLGIGSLLLREAEARALARGCRLAGLSVEVDNPRARALYERLGYRGVGTRQTGWEVDGPGGAVDWYTTEVLDMEKPLPSTPG